MDSLRALPAVAYRDPAWLAVEKERIWHGDWVFAATEDALGASGDQLPVLVGDPIIPTPGGPRNRIPLQRR